MRGEREQSDACRRCLQTISRIETRIYRLERRRARLDADLAALNARIAALSNDVRTTRARLAAATAAPEETLPQQLPLSLEQKQEQQKQENQQQQQQSLPSPLSLPEQPKQSLEEEQQPSPQLQQTQPQLQPQPLSPLLVLPAGALGWASPSSCATDTVSLELLPEPVLTAICDLLDPASLRSLAAACPVIAHIAARALQNASVPTPLPPPLLHHQQQQQQRQEQQQQQQQQPERRCGLSLLHLHHIVPRLHRSASTAPPAAPTTAAAPPRPSLPRHLDLSVDSEPPPV